MGALLAALLLSFTAHALAVPAAPAAPATPTRWSRLTEPVFQTLARSQGLPNDVVYSVAQDAQGFLWIGTVSGLARWDGYAARLYRSGPPAAGLLPDGWIQVLQQDAAGRLWVGTSGGGLARYDAALDRFDTVGAGPRGLSHVNVHALLDDGSGRLWVGTDGGLDRIDARTLQVTPQASAGAALAGLPRTRVLSLLRDGEGRLWVGTELGLFRQSAPGAPAHGGAAAFERVPLAADVQPAVQALQQDSRGRVWIGTQQHGAFVWGAGQPSARALQLTPWQGTPLQDEHVTSISEVRPGVVWLATLGQGVVEIQLGGDSSAQDPSDSPAALLGAGWDARRIRHTPASPGSLADNTVRSLFRDRAGLLWLATDRGISRHDPTQTAVMTMFGLDASAASRAGAEISWILPTADGRLWLGTHKQGVVIVDPAGGAAQALRPDATQSLSALPQDIVLAIVEGLAQEKYIATKRGLYRASADGRQLQRLPLAGRDPAASTWALWRDGETLWIGGGTDGLWSLDLRSGRSQRRSSPGGEVAAADTAAWQLSEDRVTVIAAAPQGTLWVGTRNGLNRVDPQRGVLSRWLPERDNPQALAGGFITAVHTDRAGRLWVGTFGAGLSLIERPLEQPLRVRRLSAAEPGAGRPGAAEPRAGRAGAAEGLPDDNVNALLEDAQGRVWASTDSGLALIDPATLSVRALRASDGVMFPIYWTGAAARTAQGELLFGGAGGMTVVRPEAVSDWRYTPPVVVTALQVGGQPRPPQALQAGQRLDIAPEANSLIVEFAALDYSDPARLRYATMLQGVDRDWVETDAQHRLVSHAKLPPGDYTLLLRATNRHGLWTDKPLQLPLRVLPAWYQTWWARVGGVLAVLLLGALTLQLRTRRLRQQQAWLERRVDERTAQLREVTQRLAEKSTALERKSMALEQASLTDPLTGLHNRRYLTGRLATPGAGDAGFAMLLIDIDHFKLINDSRGHAVGDAALVAVAQRLQQQLRPGDHLVRWGGEEFLLVAHGIAARGAAALAERLRRCIHAPVALSGHASHDTAQHDIRQDDSALLTMTVSIGFACLPFEPEPPGDRVAPPDADKAAASAATQAGGAALLSWEDALALADLALYAAKRSSRNCWMGLAAGPQLRGEGLVQRALADPQACVAQGELELISQGDAGAMVSALRGH